MASPATDLGQTGSKCMLLTTMRSQHLILVYHFPQSGEETEAGDFPKGVVENEDKPGFEGRVFGSF